MSSRNFSWSPGLLFKFDFRCFAKHGNQIDISWRKVQGRELGARDPTHLLAEGRSWLAEQFTSEEVQLDDAFAILVRDAMDLVTDTCTRVELFGNLSFEAGDERLIRITLSPRELPVTLEVRAAETPRDQITAVTFDYRCGHYDAGQ